MRSIKLNRKILSIILCVVLICVFTLTIAYAALSVTLNIVGNAEVVASNWDIHLDNPVVRSGSVNSNVPVISGNNLTFSANLTIPGDFYEFTVDVVNDGDIDAMIDSVVKTPELTTEQAKYIKYEVSYQNGESISTKQTLSAGTSMPIKVKVEFRTDLEVSDLPSTATNLNLKLTLVYVQGDETGSSVSNNGRPLVFSDENDDINKIGTIVTIGSESFYVIGNDGNNLKLFAKYNLYVGNYVTSSEKDEIEDATGLQSVFAKGAVYKSGTGEDNYPFFGTVAFSSNSKKGVNYSSYSGSIVEEYVNNYKKEIEKFGVDVKEARLITYDELTNSETFGCVDDDFCSTKYPWIYSTSYWSGTDFNSIDIWAVTSEPRFMKRGYYLDNMFGIRPVIVIDKDLVIERKIIDFTVGSATYSAYEGMTWREWVDSAFDEKDDFGVSGEYVGHYRMDENEFYECLLDNEDFEDANIILLDDVIIEDCAYYSG